MSSEPRPRVCILTPGQVGSNPRVVKEAEALHAAGYATTVIATRILDAVEPRDRSVMATAGFEIRRIDLRAGPAWKARRLVQTAAAGLHAASRWPAAALLGHSAATPALARAARATPADLYVAHYPAALPAAASAAARNGGLFAYDAEDFHLGDWPDGPEHDGRRALIQAIESRFLARCAYVTAASPGIAEACAQAYGIARPRVILNVFPLAQGAPAPTARGEAEPGPSLYWFSQTIGPNRGLEYALKAVAAAKSRPHLVLRGAPAAGYAGMLERMAVELGAADRLRILPPEAPSAMERLAAGHDLGLCGEPGHTRNNAIALPNKLFSYLLAGVPPLLSDTPAHRAFAAEAGLGQNLYPVDDHEAIAARLDHLLGDAGRLATARAEAWRLGRERFNWDRESAALLDLVAEACHGRG